MIMKAWSIILLISISVSFGTTPKTGDNLNTAANAGYLSPIEKEIVYEINLFRSNPADYAEIFIAPRPTEELYLNLNDKNQFNNTPNRPTKFPNTPHTIAKKNGPVYSYLSPKLALITRRASFPRKK